VTHIRIHGERECEVLEEREIIAQVPIDRRSSGTLIHFIFVVVHGSTVFFIVGRIVVHHFRVTRFLVHLSRFGCFIELPDTVYFKIPDFTNRLADIPFVAGVIDFLSVFVILIIKVIDAVFIIRESERSIPSKVLDFHVTGVERQFKTRVSYLTQVGGDAAKTGEVRQALVHNHVMRLFVVPFHATGKAAV